MQKKNKWWRNQELQIEELGDLPNWFSVFIIFIFHFHCSSEKLPKINLEELQEFVSRYRNGWRRNTRGFTFTFDSTSFKKNWFVHASQLICYTSFIYLSVSYSSSFQLCIWFQRFRNLFLFPLRPINVLSSNNPYNSSNNCFCIYKTIVFFCQLKSDSISKCG